MNQWKYNIWQCVYDQCMDHKYGIKTCKPEELTDNKPIYYRYGATGYAALKQLFCTYAFHDSDFIVDVGCGKGRVLVSAAAHGCKHIVGIEVNQGIAKIANENIRNFQKKYSHLQASIEVNPVDSNEFQIQPKMNRFIFNNPCYIKIILNLIHKIKVSISQMNREVMLYFYNPTDSWLQMLDTVKGLERIDMLHTRHDKSFAIYKIIEKR